jgi:hypothetical protein
MSQQNFKQKMDILPGVNCVSFSISEPILAILPLTARGNYTLARSFIAFRGG